MAVLTCENCEKPFCFECDSDSGICARCGRPYCGDCVKQGETCGCSPTPDED